MLGTNTLEVLVGFSVCGEERLEVVVVSLSQLASLLQEGRWSKHVFKNVYSEHVFIT